jgi:hypothetical protein
MFLFSVGIRITIVPLYDNFLEASSRRKINSSRVKPHSDEPP